MPSSYSAESYYGDLAGTSSFGQLPKSNMRTNPKFGFGTQARFSSKTRTTTSNVDYGDRIGGATGLQADSKKKSSPSFGFGTQKRDVHNKMYLSKKHAAKSISTVTRNVDYLGDSSGMGKQTKSTAKSMPRYGFGTSQRGHASKRYQPKGF